MTIDEALSILSQKGCDPKPVPGQEGQWKSKCPVPSHDDKNPSFSIGLKEGKVLFHCHSGCDKKDVLEAMEFKTSSGNSSGKTYGLPRVGNTFMMQGRERTVTGIWVYRDAEKKPLLAVQRYEPGLDGQRKGYSQFTPSGNGWQRKGIQGKKKKPIYNLHPIDEDRTYCVVEGEKCVDAAQKAFPNNHWITWPQGAGKALMSDWSWAKGKRFLLISDADSPSRKSMDQLARHLFTLGVSDLRVALPGGEDHKDIYNWIGEGTAVENLQALTRPWAPPAAPTEVEDSMNDESLGKNEHYSILGTDEERIVFHITKTGLLVRNRETCCQPNTLIALCDEMWWHHFHGEEKLTPDWSRRIGNRILRIAEQKGPVDMSILQERGAFRIGEAVFYHLGDRLLTPDGREVSFEEISSVCISAPRISLGAPADDSRKKAVMDAVMRYGWRTENDGKLILSWIVTSLIGGALHWRPHLIFNAPAERGKGFILRDVVQKVSGRHICPITSNFSVAGISRYMKSASLPIVLDESEAKDLNVDQVLHLVRTASDGIGDRLRADGQSGVLSYTPKFSVLWSSVTMPAWSRAEETRFHKVELGAEVDDWLSVRDGIWDALRHPEDIRSAIIRDAGAIIEKAKELENGFLAMGGMSSRNSAAAAALTAAWHWWGGKGSVGAKERERGSEATDCLKDILAAPIRLPDEGERTVETVLNDTARDSYTKERGIKVDNDGNLVIAAQHSGLSRLMKGTAWEKVNISMLLLQIEGAEYTNPLAFEDEDGGRPRMRAVKIPKEVLISLGAEIHRGFQGEPPPQLPYE